MTFAPRSPQLARQAEPGRTLQKAMALVLGSSLLWASAKVQVPFWPVPMTMQTYVVLLLGPLLGRRLGAGVVLTYLAEGAIGFPVFAGHANGLGLGYFVGPTAGYLVGYLAAVVLAGTLAEHGWDQSVRGRVMTLLVAEITILAIGCGWLATTYGWETALAIGLWPFLLGDGLKLAFAIGTLSFVKQRLSRSSNELEP